MSVSTISFLVCTYDATAVAPDSSSSSTSICGFREFSAFLSPASSAVSFSSDSESESEESESELESDSGDPGLVIVSKHQLTYSVKRLTKQV
jgi:hypothetical protein